MRWSSEINVTASPAAGVCVVPLVTVPVIVAAEAPLAKANKAQSALNLNLILIFQAAGVRFVSGQDFSRGRIHNSSGFSLCENSVLEGHGFSRAVNNTAIAGFSR
jgi:hypothetical protein